MLCEVCCCVLCRGMVCVVLTRRWPCSWSAWSLFCCLCSQSGRLGSWLKHVALLRARHPDSLALQVRAHREVARALGPFSSCLRTANCHPVNRPWPEISCGSLSCQDYVAVLAAFGLCSVTWLLYSVSCGCVMQVLAAHADNLSGDQSSACSAYAAALQ